MSNLTVNQIIEELNMIDEELSGGVLTEAEIAELEAKEIELTAMLPPVIWLPDQP